MGVPVFILGQSGTGKSTSLRNFKSGEILHINVMGKPLPFKGRFAETYNGDNYGEIVKAINKTKKKTIVIDDAQYLMANEFMRRSSEKGYDKFTEIGYNFWSLLDGVTKDIPFDVVVYFLMHTEQNDNGDTKAKTIGKLLDEKITLEGMTSIVLKTSVKDGVYSFLTQNNGHDTVKSPLGMFDTYEIENDLKAVDTRIRDYWELDTPIEMSGDIMKAHDEEVDAGGVSTEAPKAEKPSRRRKNRSEAAEEDDKETKRENRKSSQDVAEDDTEEKSPRRRRKRDEEPVEEEPAEEKPRRRRRRHE